jgi:hypothetical protein
MLKKMRKTIEEPCHTTIQFRVNTTKKESLEKLAKTRGLRNLNELMRIVCDDILDNPNRKFILKERVI